MSRLSVILLSTMLLLANLYGYCQNGDPVLISDTFYDTPLVKALKRLKRKYKIKFAYDHKLLAHHKITQKY